MSYLLHFTVLLNFFFAFDRKKGGPVSVLGRAR